MNTEVSLTCDDGVDYHGEREFIERRRRVERRKDTKPVLTLVTNEQRKPIKVAVLPKKQALAVKLSGFILLSSVVGTIIGLSYLIAYR